MRQDATVEVWLGTDTAAEFVLVNGEPLTDLSAVTRVLFCIGGQTADSDVLGSSVIWWTDSVTAKTLPDGTLFTGDVVLARLGQATLDVGVYEECRLLIFALAFPNGIVVSDNIQVTVYGTC